MACSGSEGERNPWDKRRRDMYVLTLGAERALAALYPLSSCSDPHIARILPSNYDTV